MVIGIYFNEKRINCSDFSIDGVLGVLTASGCEYKLIAKREDISKVNILLVLGGDGTILNVATDCAKFDVPILGVNFGNVGFLSEFEREKIKDALNLLISGDFIKQRRSLIEIKIGNKTYFALNDLVVQRATGVGRFGNTISISAEIDGTLVDNYRADGIIVSTPTGSTAYSLSAGGSILTPDINAFILSPICAHSLHSRPIVYNDKSKLRLNLSEVRTHLNISVDGRTVENCGKIEYIEVTKAEKYVEFICSPDNDFFKKLLIKLSKWSR